MANVNVLNWKKEKVGSIELDPAIFDVEVKTEVLHTVTKWQLASRRSGTHSTKTRSYVSGGGKKPFKQKGTGNARQGSSRSPLMPGGAKVFGPLPKSYAFALPKKIRKLGLKMALSHLQKTGKLFIVADMTAEGKTKELAARLKGFGLSKAVLIDASTDVGFKRATCNLKSFKYQSTEGINVFDLLKYDAAILTKSCVASIVEKMKAE